MKKSSKNVSSDVARRNLWGGVVALIIIFFVIASLILAGIFFKDVLFTHNKNFIIRDIEITSTAGDISRWAQMDGESDICRILGIKRNETNLFSLDFDQCKAYVLKECPGIEDISLSRELPNRLKVDIVERMPLATLRFVGPDGRSIELLQNVELSSVGQSPIGTFLVDYSGMVMSRNDCAQLDLNFLPQIIFQTHYLADGAMISVRTGDDLAILDDALALLAEAKLRDGFVIEAITLEVRSEKLEFLAPKHYVIRFNCNDVVSTALLPSGNVIDLLDTLESAIAKSVAIDRSVALYDLTFKNQVILK